MSRVAASGRSAADHPTRISGRGQLRRRRLAIAAIGLILAGAAGCSGDDDRPARYPIRGRVTVDGEPASGAFVALHPATPEPAGEGVPSAQARPDGTFAVTTLEEADGAPAGDYAVTVQWHKLVIEGGEAIAGPNVVPDRYAHPETTPLRVTIRPGNNPTLELPIERRRSR